MSATITMYDGMQVVVACRICACDVNPPCDWCCLPIDYTNPLYPLGVMKDIPFSLVGCQNYNGTFRVNPANVPCQEELIYDDINTFNSPFLQTPSQALYTELAGVCSTTPCSTPFFYKLECTSRYLQPGDDSSCDRLWLWIGTRAITQVGDTGETPGGYDYGAASWTRVRATSCMCDSVDGVIASFDASFTADCYGATIGTVGSCAGHALDCCEVSCSATLTI